MVILNNIQHATKHDWGVNFCGVLRSLSQQYAIDYRHSDVTLTNIIDQLQKVDNVHDYSLAPAPEQANSVDSAMDLLANYVRDFAMQMKLTKSRLSVPPTWSPTVLPPQTPNTPAKPKRLASPTGKWTNADVVVDKSGIMVAVLRRSSAGRTTLANIAKR